jgi:hypothetical protein
MNYYEVVGIVGGPGRQQRHSDIAGNVGDVYTWKGEGVGSFDANVFVQFQNGAVVSKVQFGLA